VIGNKVELGLLANIKTGKLDANASVDGGKYPFFTCSKKPLQIDDYSFDGNYVLVAGNGDLNVKHYVGKFDAYQRTYAIQTDQDKLFPRYLYYFLNKYVEVLRNLSIGGVIKYIKLGNLTGAKIPLPPLAEQKKIAAILDAADRLRQKDAQLIAKYNTLSQSLFLAMFGDPVTNPMGWKTIALESACENIYGGGTPSKSKPEYFNGLIPWVTPKDMKKAYINNSIDHISDEALNNSSAKTIPIGSVLMVIRSGILKHTLPLAITTGIVTVNQDMKAFIPRKTKTNAQFLMHYFMGVERFLLGKVRAVTADNIEFRQIKKLPFPLPPITLQNQFAERIQAIEAQKQQAQAALQKSEDLFSSLLQRAFKGELTA